MHLFYFKTLPFMKKIIVLLIVASISFLATSLILLQEEKFYYAFDEKIRITESKDKIAVQFKENISRDIINNKIKSISSARQFELRNNAVFLEVNDEKKRMMQAYRQLPEVQSAQPVFKLNTGLEMGLNDEIVVKFKSNVYNQQMENTTSTRFQMALIH